jgi:hypothetical protein
MLSDSFPHFHLQRPQISSSLLLLLRATCPLSIIPSRWFDPDDAIVFYNLPKHIFRNMALEVDLTSN